MPTYDYLCADCGFRFEEFQSITAQPLANCPRCKGTVRRLIGTGNGFLFKGSGFYTTDYRSNDYNKSKDKEVNGNTKTASDKKEDKTEQKTAVNKLA